MVNTAPESANPGAPASAKPSGATVKDGAPEFSVRLNLRQKLAEVHRRIGYVQKRGHNELLNYSYVTAADIAGVVGDLLAELGVVVIPGSRRSPTNPPRAEVRPSAWREW
jgi:hypothetical protein